MNEIKTIPDVWYTVTTTNGCKVYRADGVAVLKEVEAGQGWFRAVESVAFVDDANAIIRPFDVAPVAFIGGGGGGLTAEKVKEVTPISWSPGSFTAPTASGNYTLSIGFESSASGYNSVAIGKGATSGRCSVAIGNAGSKGAKASSDGVAIIGSATGSLAVAIGISTSSSGSQAVSLGANSYASGERSIGIGQQAYALGKYSLALGAGPRSDADYVVTIGRNAKGADVGVVVFRSSAADGTYTQFYFSGANTPLANAYHDGAPMLGYVTKDSAGNIVAAGTRSLIDLLTDNSTFAPASLDADGEWVQPTVFHPSDLDLPEEEAFFQGQEDDEISTAAAGDE